MISCPILKQQWVQFGNLTFVLYLLTSDCTEKIIKMWSNRQDSVSCGLTLWFSVLSLYLTLADLFLDLCWTRLRWSDQTQSCSSLQLSSHQRQSQSVFTSSSCVCVQHLRAFCHLRDGHLADQFSSPLHCTLQRPDEQIRGQDGLRTNWFRKVWSSLWNPSSLFGLFALPAPFPSAASSHPFNSFFSASLSYRGLRRTLTLPHVPMRSQSKQSEGHRRHRWCTR